MELSGVSGSYHFSMQGIYRRQPNESLLKRPKEKKFRKILIIDDYPPLTSMYGTNLELIGLLDKKDGKDKSILTAVNYVSALKILAQNTNNIDLIIIGDVKQSNDTKDIDPIKFAAQGRALAAINNRYIPTVAISTNCCPSSPSMLEQLTANGLCDFALDKGSDIGHFFDVIEKIFEMSPIFNALAVNIRNGTRFGEKGENLREKLFDFICNKPKAEFSNETLKEGIEIINDTIKYVKEDCDDLFEAYTLLNMAQRAIYVCYNPERYLHITKLRETSNPNEPMYHSEQNLELKGLAEKHLYSLWDKVTGVKERFLLSAWNPTNMTYDTKMSWLN